MQVQALEWNIRDLPPYGLDQGVSTLFEQEAEDSGCQARETDPGRVSGQLRVTNRTSHVRTIYTILMNIFLVCSFSLKEKSPTITVDSFYSFSAYNLTLNGPLFLQFLQS